MDSISSFLADQARIGSYLLDCRQFEELSSLSDERDSTNTSTSTSRSRSRSRNKSKR